jgi:hypothetical protein
MQGLQGLYLGSEIVPAVPVESFSSHGLLTGKPPAPRQSPVSAGCMDSGGGVPRRNVVGRGEPDFTRVRDTVLLQYHVHSSTVYQC